MKRRYLAFVALLCTAGPLVCEPISDLRAFHAAWVVAQDGKQHGEAAMILGGLDVFTRLSPHALTEDETLGPTWEKQIDALRAEVLFLSRSGPAVLPRQTSVRRLPAQILTVAPGEQVQVTLPDGGNQAALVLNDVHLRIIMANVAGTPLCATKRNALFCALDAGQTMHARFLNEGRETAEVLLLGEPR